MTFDLLQATLLAAITDSPLTKKLWEQAVSVLQKSWRSKKGLARESLSLVLSSEVHLSSLILLGCLADFLSAKGSEDPLEKSEQDAMLNYFGKAVLSSRAKPLQSTITSCSGVFKTVTHEQFSSILLQPTLKCLLRNPDELLEGRLSLAHRGSDLAQFSAWEGNTGPPRKFYCFIIIVSLKLTACKLAKLLN